MFTRIYEVLKQPFSTTFIRYASRSPTAYAYANLTMRPKNRVVKSAIFRRYIGKNIVFDVEYMMILTKLESMIIFAPLSPFVIPLTICSVNSNYFIYRKLVESDRLRIKTWDINAGILLKIGKITI